jgi:hypothetical protein
MKTRILTLLIALGALAISACDTVTNPVIGRLPGAPPDTTKDSVRTR